MRIKYNGPGSPVLHTKVHGNRSTGSEGEDFLPYTLNRSYKWPPFIFQASSESKNRSCNIYGSINELRLCQDSGSNFISE